MVYWYMSDRECAIALAAAFRSLDCIGSACADFHTTERAHTFFADDAFVFLFVVFL